MQTGLERADGSIPKIRRRIVTADSRYSYLSHRADGREERGFDRFGYVSHIFSTTAKIAYWMWRLAEMKMMRTGCGECLSLPEGMCGIVCESAADPGGRGRKAPYHTYQ
ncbi:MAG: hypothetical protein ACLR6I_00735 [Waltera sp.]